MKGFSLTVLFILLGASQVFAQSRKGLKQKVSTIVSGKNAVVGVAISGENGMSPIFINGKWHFPMQSVFKLPIALALLSEIDDGHFSLDQKMTITEDELLKNTWSPIRERYPRGTTMPLSELIQYTVSLSDNNGCDILLDLIGGPQEVEAYFQDIGIKNISIKVTEHEMHEDWDAQFKNWITPKAANKLLRAFYYNKSHLLSPKTYNFIWTTLRGTKTGQHKIRGQLPENATVAHKTGWSGVSDEGVIAADNDMGVVTLPNGHHFFVSVFITHSKESSATNKKIIASIAKAAWNYFTGNKNK